MSLKNKKLLIAYFSHAGENYVNGAIKKLEIGNTKAAAEMLKEFIGGDLFYIDTVKKYPDNHMDKINIAQKELESNFRPELAEHIVNMQDYDVIVLCYPNWWGTCPMAVFSFLEEYNFSGKLIAPLCTHEGSGFGRSIKDIAKTVPKSIIFEGLAIRGGKVTKEKETIRSWALSL